MTGEVTNRGADRLMAALAYYGDQSPITDPGRMARHLAGVPHDLAALQRIAAPTS